ncbi:hypothetical protein AB0C28_49095 [Nonomuraea sp. NPDC048892]|uniref:hypothetical protein n=1 Tax=Nonomuraea sp. NPDC048892 TaxID=3154624 RepID=UPI003407F8CA
MWSDELLRQFDPNLVWASRFVCNNAYDGVIREMGDQVVINGLTRPTVGAYNATTGMTVENLETVAQNLRISQADYVAFYVTDIDRHQTAGVLSEPATQETIAGIAFSADTFVSGVISASASTIPAIDVSGLTTSAAKGEALLEGIFDMMEDLDTNKVPGGRYVIVSPKVKRHLLRASDIANASILGQGDATANGVVASLAGFTVLSTTAMPTGVDIFAGHPAFTTFASQFTGFRTQPSEKFRADQIDCLHLYGARVLSFPGGAQPANADAVVLNSEGLIKTSVVWQTP